MNVSHQELLHYLARLPFIDAGELALILGEPLATVHRALTALLKDGLAQRVSHGTAHLPSSHRYHLTRTGISAGSDALGFDAPSELVRAYPVSRQWMALLIRRMDAVASVYRLAATLSPGVDGLCSLVEFHRRGRFDAVITLHNGRSFGVVRQGLALRRRSLYGWMRAIVEYDHTRRPSVVLVLVPSAWEQRLTDDFCRNVDLRDCYVATESTETLEGWDRRVWLASNWLFGRSHCTLEQVASQAETGRRFRAEAPERKRASLPDPERMVHAAPAFGVSPSEKRALDLITDHPMIPREHLARWLGVLDGRVSQMTRSLQDPWGLIEQHGKRSDVRYTLSEGGIRYATRRDRAQLLTTMAAWSTEETSEGQGKPRPLDTTSSPGHARPATPTASPGSCPSWPPRPGLTATANCNGRFPPPALTGPSTGATTPSPRTPWDTCWPTACTCPSTSSTSCGPAIPRGVAARLRPYSRYYRSDAPAQEQPPFPITLFVVDSEEVADTYVSAASGMITMSLPILVSCREALSRRGILGRSWRPLWDAECPPLALRDLGAYGGMTCATGCVGRRHVA